ncbi:alanine racemase [Nocardioides bruguierae]|uniref:Alanine racemase n=1 Tax=Nocardioides bruguierae TaxID=2945102 RepID=A0A9X2D6D2_9ACTN|nr:alanine racemase [Nocardioides bruguierae]MCM0619064.1 alanine racemase [Nocardioides bruguierae]
MPVPPTPHLRVDPVRLRRNVRRAADRAAAAGVLLRPHAKTYKCLEVARLQLAGGAAGLTVATVGEAEVLVRAGVRDLFLAYPVWVDDDRADRLRALAEHARVAIGVDSVMGAANSGRRLGGSGVEVLVEIDSGHHRTGVAPADAGEVAAAAARAGLPVRGAFTFPGHSYSPDAPGAAAVAEREALLAARLSMEAAGVPVHVLSGGSTPSLAASLDAALGGSSGGSLGAPPGASGPGDAGADDPGLARVQWEQRPGVYVFNDAQQWELGTCEPGDVALTARATVVSHASGRLVLDSGSKVLGADRAPWATGWGRLLERPDARIVQLSEHHAVVEMEGVLPRVGTQVDVVPNHVCNAVNLADALWADEHGGLHRWPVAARGLNG